MSNYVYYNPNPQGQRVGDCTVRALSKALDQDWETTYAGLTATGFMMADMPSANHVWGTYLKRKGFIKKLIDDHGRTRYTVNDFCVDYPTGTYVLAMQGHVACIESGRLYDTWDSSGETPLYYWERK